MKKTLIVLLILIGLADIAMTGYYFGQKNILKKIEILLQEHDQ